LTDPLTLSATSIVVGYDKRRVIDGLSLQVPQGRITALVGPNACGKSTLIRALARLQPLMDGAVVLDGADINAMPTRSVARRLGILPQSPRAPEGITVADLVWRGRHPHHRLGGRRSRADNRVIAESLLQTGTSDLFDRPVDALSGGQRQRVWLAMALAQQTPALLLDEPTTFLDVAHQLELLDLLVDLNRDHGKTIVLVLHDLEQAAHYASTIIAMKDGHIVAQGDPVEILTEQLVWDVFGVRARILPDPDTGSPLVLARGRHEGPHRQGVPAPHSTPISLTPEPEFSGKSRNQ
jgi:iron complex transport system ATP-binding protein